MINNNYSLKPSAHFEIKKKKAIIFDLGGVLMHWNPQEIARNIRVKDEAIPDNIHSITQTNAWHCYNKGDLSKSLLIHNYSHLFNKEHLEYFIDSAIEHFSPITQGIAIAHALHQKGYQLYILSNLPEDFHNHCKKNYNIFDLFDGAIFSYQVKSAKPEPTIYQALLKNYFLNPEEIVFIDDLPENIEAGKRLGIDGIVCDNYEQVMQSLSKIGIDLSI